MWADARLACLPRLVVHLLIGMLALHSCFISTYDDKYRRCFPILEVVPLPELNFDNVFQHGTSFGSTTTEAVILYRGGGKEAA
eukprot:scaffold48213_cov22-Tisochrysis_lutea.AAC.1